ncbi:MAG: hypothetical protein AB1476_00060 [Candidatus Hadarchaeota archaeon]
MAKPAADALAASKLSAQTQISSLSAVGTSQSATEAATFATRIETAGSQGEVQTILSEINTATVREQKRKELLSLADTAANGVYYNTSTTTALANLKTTLEGDINSKTSLADLEAYETELASTAATSWRSVFTTIINGITDNRLSMTKLNGLPYGEFMSKDNALAFIANQPYDNLRKMKFEDATVRVPIMDTFQRTPTLKVGSVIYVYVYDTTQKTLTKMFGNAEVKNVVYSRADIGTISWTYGVSTFSVDMWETIKAAAAGDATAEGLGWQGYGADVMDRSLTSNVGNYSSSVLYMIEVSDPVGEEIVKYEFHQTDKDVILLPVV